MPKKTVAGKRLRTQVYLGSTRRGVHVWVPAIIDTGSTSVMVVPQGLIKNLYLKLKEKVRRRAIDGRYYFAREARAHIVWPRFFMGKGRIFIIKGSKKDHATIGMKLIAAVGGKLQLGNRSWKIPKVSFD